MENKNKNTHQRKDDDHNVQVHIKNDIQLSSVTLQGTQLEIEQRPQHITLRFDYDRGVKLGKHIYILVPGKYYLNRTKEGKTLTSTMNKWDLIKLERFCIVKGSIIQKDRLQNNERICMLVRMQNGMDTVKVTV